MTFNDLKVLGIEISSVVREETNSIDYVFKKSEKTVTITKTMSELLNFPGLVRELEDHICTEAVKHFLGGTDGREEIKQE